MAACEKAELVCDERCREVLARHYDTSGWKFKVVADGEELLLGRRTLKFIETPMVHWPESMATYVPQEKLLFSMDGFGQHLAASNRFDDENPLDVIMAEAKSYYANILMLYGSPIGRTLEKAAGLDIEMIAPSHGVIWRKNLGAIISAYQRWIVQRPAAKVLVVYDSMWQSTAMMAQAIMEGASGEGVEAKLMHIRSTGNTRIVTEVLDAAAIAFGSPTLNGTMMPQVAATLTYLKGLKPAGKAGFVFGSYGWAKGAGKDMGEYLAAMKFDVLREPLLSQNVPGEEVLDECRAAGKMLAGKARELASAAG
jgi:flavorubredoxin